MVVPSLNSLASLPSCPTSVYCAYCVHCVRPTTHLPPLPPQHKLAFQYDLNRFESSEHQLYCESGANDEAHLPTCPSVSCTTNLIGRLRVMRSRGGGSRGGDSRRFRTTPPRAFVFALLASEILFLSILLRHPVICTRSALWNMHYRFNAIETGSSTPSLRRINTEPRMPRRKKAGHRSPGSRH